MEDIYNDAAAYCDIRWVLRNARALRANPRGRYGLCHTLGLYHLPENLVEAIFESWPHYTGLSIYPVPEPGAQQDDTAAAKDAYDDAYDMYTGEYGALRLNLLDHLIAELEKLVN